MIIFKKVRFKNFISFGNTWTEIDLANEPSTLIAGRNSAGKSSMILESITFALFGKAFRKMKLGQLVNNINNRGMVVELYFVIGKTEYKIIRGISPGIFEIYQNGKLIPKDAKSKDYQLQIEEQILQMPYHTFTQIFALGAATFTPFMQLPAGARREVIEDVLSIKIFTDMNRLLKEKISINNENLKEAEFKIKSLKTKSDYQQKMIKFIEEQRDVQIAKLLGEIQEYQDNRKQCQVELNKLKADHVAESDILSTLPNPGQLISDLEYTLRSKIGEKKSIDQKKTRMQNLDDEVCPTCHQDIGCDHKQKIIDQYDDEIIRIKEFISESDIKLTEYKDQLSKYHAQSQKVDILDSRITKVTVDIQNIDIVIDQLEDKIAKIKHESSDIEKERAILKEIAAEALDIIKNQKDLKSVSNIQRYAVFLLKDSEIKASIIKKYLPQLNTKINQYLEMFDFFAKFTLDEEFNETIKIRKREDTTYSSLSVGEQRKIDLSLMLAFRDLAANKNSTHFNLLIFDEVDSGLDRESLEKFVTLVNSLDDVNSFVISHTISSDYNLRQLFPQILEVQKPAGGFSKITQLV